MLKTLDGRRISYTDADRQASRMAQCLKSSGLEPGDRVSVQVEKTPEALFLYLGCLRGGFIYHPLNPAYRKSELAYFLANAEPSMVVSDEGSQLQALATEKGIACHTLVSDGSGSLIDAYQSQSSDFATLQGGVTDTAVLLYSSGTTGTAKGIPLTHANLISNAEALTSLWGFEQADRLLHALPIFHVHGLFVALGCALMSGASMLWLPRFDVERVRQNLSRCTVMMGVPTYYTRLLAEDQFGHQDSRHMRLFVSGSAPLSMDTFNEFQTRTGHKILERYGMTETGMNTSNPLVGQRKAGTVGKPLPGVEVRIVDEYDQAVESGVVGRVQVKGPNVFPGYWRIPNIGTVEFTEDGFFRTGDLGMMDSDGYVSIAGRSKDLIISGGLNVYPKEIENVLNNIPGVLESAVIGVADQDFGEIVIGVVVCKAGVQLTELEIISHTKRELASYKVPKNIQFSKELPRNAMGKVQKNVLRELFVSS